MITVIVFVFLIVSLLIALLAVRDLGRTPPRVPPTHPRRTTTVLDETGEQVDQTVFPAHRQ